MLTPTQHGSLPDYENPPVAETVLGVQFDRLPKLKNAHLGGFWKTLDKEEWPNVQDVPVLATHFERFNKSTGWAPGTQLQFTQDPSSRLQIKSRIGDRMIQLQNNRLHFNWLGEAESYPRYDKVREELEHVLRGFITYIHNEDAGDFRPNQWEVTYVNHIPQGTVWNTPCDWSFFKPLAGLSTADGHMEFEGFSGTWDFVIPDQKGRLHVQWQHGLKSTSSEAEKPTVRLMFTARGPLQATDGDDSILQAITDGLDLGHQTIVSSFKELMSDDANQYWGLRDVND